MSQSKDSQGISSLIPQSGKIESNLKQAKFKTNKRGSKIVLTGDEATLRLAKSGSVKQKLNLQNTKLQINIDNLNSTIRLKKQNETILEDELEKYRKKLKKYKEKIKNKDHIIVELISKIQRQIPNRSKLIQKDSSYSDYHSQQIEIYKKELELQQIPIANDMLGNYVELFQKYSEQSKSMIIIDTQCQQYKQTIDVLKARLNSSSNIYGQQKQKGSQTQLQQYMKLLDKQRNVRLGLQNIINQESIGVSPELEQQIQHLEQLYEEPINVIGNKQQNDHMEIKQQSGNQHKKLKEELNISRKHVEQIQKNLQQIIQKVELLDTELSQNMEFKSTLTQRLEEHSQKTQQINSIVQELRQSKERFSQLAKIRENDCIQWTQMYESLNRFIDQLVEDKQQLQIQLDFQQQKRNKFQISLLAFEPEKHADSSLNPSQMYLDEKIQGIKRQIHDKKQDNVALTSQLKQRNQEFQIMQLEYNYIQQELYVTKQKIKSLNGEPEQQIRSPKHTENQKYFNEELKTERQLLQNQNIVEKCKKYVQGIEIQSLKEKCADSMVNQQLLKKRLTQLKNQNIRLKIDQQKLKRGVKALDSEINVQSKRQQNSGRDQQKQAMQKQINEILNGQTQLQLEYYSKLAKKYIALAEDIDLILAQKMKDANDASQKVDADSQDHDESQDMIQESYKNINEEIDRLTLKCQKLEKQNQKIKKANNQQIQKLQKQNQRNATTIKIRQRINQDLTNLILYLEGQLSKKDNIDQSSQSLLKSQDIKERDDYRDGIAHQRIQQIKALTQKHQQYLGSNKDETKRSQIQQQIKDLNKQLRESISGSIKAQKQNDKNKQTQQCKKCKQLLKVNAELIGKVKKFQKQKRQRQSEWQNQLNTLKQQQLQEDQSSPEQFRERFYQLKAMFLGFQSQMNIININTEKQSQQLQQAKVTIRNLTKQVILIQKQNMNMKNILYQGDQSQMNIKHEQMPQEFKKNNERIQKRQQREHNQVNKEDLFETINFLHQQIQYLKQKIQIYQQNNYRNQQQEQQEQEGVDHTQNIWSNKSKQALQTKNKSKYQLLIQNSNLKEQMHNFLEKYQTHLALLEDGRGAEIIEEKDNLIQELSTQIIDAESLNLSLQKQKKHLEEQLRKMGGQLQQIEAAMVNIQHFNENKQNQHKYQDGQKIEMTGQITNVDSTNIHDRTQLQSFSRKWQLLKQKANKLIIILENQNKKAKPNQIEIDFEQFLELNGIIKIFYDWLNILWSMVEQRTQQFNELRDQMNLISMECLKNSQQDQQIQDVNSSGRVGSSYVIEERYEQVLAQLIQYENLNKRLERQIAILKEEVKTYRIQLEQAHSRYIGDLKSDSSSQILPYSQQALKMIIEGQMKHKQYTMSKESPEIIKLLLIKIEDSERKLQVLQGQVQQKNKKFDTLIQRQVSFQSDRSQKNKDHDKSIVSDNSIHKDKLRQESSKLLNKSEDRSLSVLNSAQLFKQIQELARCNEEIKKKDEKQKKQLLIFRNSIERSLQSDIIQEAKPILENILSTLNSLFEQIGLHTFPEPEQQQYQQLIANDNLSQQILMKKQKNKKEDNIRFLEDNKFLLEQLINKANSKLQQPQDFNSFKEKLALTFTGQELQDILYIMDEQAAIDKLISILNDTGQMKQEQSWVEGSDIQEIINRIYPQRTQLCSIVARSLEILLSAESSSVILKVVENLFDSISRKQKQFQQVQRRKQDVMTEYAKKMQKILLAKSSDDGGSFRDLAMETSLKRTTEIKSDYEIKKKQQGDESLSEGRLEDSIN